MKQLRRFKQKLSAVFHLWQTEDFDSALTQVEGMLEIWPGNAQLHLLQASLVQLQENPQQSLDDAKQALQLSAELDSASPGALIELGHFLDNVEDNPHAAAKCYADGVGIARQLLIEGLI